MQAVLVVRLVLEDQPAVMAAILVILDQLEKWVILVILDQELLVLLDQWVLLDLLADQPEIQDQLVILVILDLPDQLVLVRQVLLARMVLPGRQAVLLEKQGLLEKLVLLDIPE
jgi:hypothetical protein